MSKPISKTDLIWIFGRKPDYVVNKPRQLFSPCTKEEDIILMKSYVGSENGHENHIFKMDERLQWDKNGKCDFVAYLENSQVVKIFDNIQNKQKLKK